MPDQSTVRAILDQGGFAALAMFCVWLLYKMGTAWAADNKEGRMRERESRESIEELHRNTLLVIGDIRQALGALIERQEARR